MRRLSHEDEAAVVAVEARLDSIWRRERGRHDLERIVGAEAMAAGQCVVGWLGLHPGLSGGEYEARRRVVLIGHPVGPEVAHSDVVTIPVALVVVALLSIATLG